MNPIRQTAEQLGIETEYSDAYGCRRTVSDDVLARLSALLQQNACAEADAGAHFDSAAVLEPGQTQWPLPEHWTDAEAADLAYENGETRPLARTADATALALPALSAGCYTLTLHKGSLKHRVFAVCPPETAMQPPEACRRLNGLTVQLYSLRSAQNWGIGDFADLAQLMMYAGRNGIDFVGTNPLHALFLSRPAYASPYSPSSRLRLNALYLSVEGALVQLPFAVDTRQRLGQPEFCGRIRSLRDSGMVDYEAVWALKNEALRMLFAEFETAQGRQADAARQRFGRFAAEGGSLLRGFALFEAVDGVHGAKDGEPGWLSWPQAFHDPQGAAVQTFAREHESSIRFHMWLQWLCGIQLDEVAKTAAAHGVRCGLYGDLAVGAARGGADTWLDRAGHCMEASIGAPPDPLGPLGQNWNLPPARPDAMLRGGFAGFVRLLRENMRRCGILRIDHVMSLGRLWWVPGSGSAQNGAYVRYPQDVLFALAALQSVRQNCILVGEDLGTVPESVRSLMARYRIFSCSVLYFNRENDAFRQPESLPGHALYATATHDTAPIAQWWRGSDLAILRRLGLLDDDGFQAALAERGNSKTALLCALRQAGCDTAGISPDTPGGSRLAAALHRFGAASPCRLYTVQLADLIGADIRFNIPGVAEGYPNWAFRLPCTLAECFGRPAVRSQLAMLDEVRMQKNRPHRPYPTPDSQERDTIGSLFSATHGNPFAYLGRHPLPDGSHAVRCLIPGALRVEITERGNSRRILAEAERLDDRGFFAAVLPADAPDYALAVHYSGCGQPETAEDPYRYPSRLQALDEWLLAEGTHLRPYEALGAHPAEMDGAKGANFSVWAPNAQRVSVVGDFNGWDGRRHVMRRHEGSGIWEIFIPAVPFNALYKFEIRDAAGNVYQKADPCAFAAELRPGTASVLRGLPEKVPAPPFRTRANAIDSPVSIYEVHLDSWRRRADGSRPDYGELAAELADYVRGMGFTHIELMPVSEYPFDGSWGYQPTGLYAPTSRFGPPEALQQLVRSAHAAGLCVILDWVAGHFPADSHGLARFDGTELYEHADPREGRHQDWDTLIYNFGRTEVRNFLQGNALYWIERFGFDGLRVDAVASMIYRDYSRKEGEWIPNRYGGRENLEAVGFLRNTNTMLQQEAPGTAQTAEESTAFAGVTRLEGLNFHYKWNMGWMNDTLRYMREDPINRKYRHNLMTFGMMYQYSENFVLPLSHDEVVHGKGSLLDKMPGDAWQKFANLRAYYGFMWAHPGKKLLFMGGEFAQGREWDYSRALDWQLLEESVGGHWHKGMQDFVRDLNHVYRQYPPLWQLDQWPEGFEWLVADDADNSVFVFERRDRAGGCVLAAANFTPVVREHYRFGVSRPGTYREILNSDRSRYTGSGIPTGCITGIPSRPEPSHGKAHSLTLTLPPLSAVYLYLPADEPENTAAPAV